MANLATLSKSRFLSGHQCDLRLWYDYHAPNLVLLQSNNAVY